MDDQPEETKTEGPVETAHHPDGAERSDRVTVGIGSSAGGLEALQKFVQNIPSNSNCTYVVAQHLSPTYKSMLVDLLGRQSGNTIVEAKHGEALAAEKVYICPPNKNITVSNGRTYLSEPDSATYSPKPNINLLFQSIAEEAGSKGVGIILSGTGTDGAQGIRAIKASNGFTFVQEPDSAKYDGMPNAAISTGSVDFILPPEQIASELLDVLTYPAHTRIEDEHSNEDGLLRKIIRRLLQVKHIDFTHYKMNTINRRIERRMAAMKVTSLTQYSNLIQKSDEEVKNLFNDILIGVTSFFRDDKAFESLKENLAEYLQKKETKTFRAWVAGCSSGEEAYALGIILSELLGDDIKNWKVQIFATDIDEESLQTARAGLYPESAVLDILSNENLRQYFNIEGDTYSVDKTVRDLVIFSRHNLIQDPPFMRLDLVSCRNLLIYFDLELQRKVFPAFHYALNNEAILFLGKSETVGTFSNLFSTIDAKNKIFRAIFTKNKHFVPLQQMPRTPERERTDKEPGVARSKFKLEDLIVDEVRRAVLPMCVIVNSTNDIVYISGKNPYFSRLDGPVTDNIFRNVLPELTTELRATVQAVEKSEQIERTPYMKVVLNKDVEKFVRLVVIPVRDLPNLGSVKIVCFQEDALPEIKYELETTGDHENEKIQSLELELARNREQLQSLIEELETSNEELQSMNEELQSSNEELQSTNEELETTNEELQSTNEELQTAYAELKSAYEEKNEQQRELKSAKDRITRRQDLFDRVQNVARVGLFDHDLLSGQFEWSNQVYAFFGADEGSFQPNLKAMQSRIHDDDRQRYDDAMEEMLKSGHLDIVIRVQAGDQIKYLQQKGEVIRAESNIPIRLLGTFRDVTELQRAKEEVQSVKQSMEKLLKGVKTGVYIFDQKLGKNTFINDEYTQILGYTEKDLDEFEADQFAEMFHPDDRERIFEHIAEVNGLPEGESCEAVYRFKHKNGDWIWCHSVDTILERDDDRDGTSFLGMFLQVDDPEIKQDVDETAYDTVMSSKDVLLNEHGVAITTLDGNLLLANKPFCDLVGYTAEELKAMNFKDLTDPEDLGHNLELFNDVIAGKTDSFEIDKNYIHKDGSKVPVTLHGLAVRTKSGEVSSIIGTARKRD